MANPKGWAFPSVAPEAPSETKSSEGTTGNKIVLLPEAPSETKSSEGTTGNKIVLLPEAPSETKSSEGTINRI